MFATKTSRKENSEISFCSSENHLSINLVIFRRKKARQIWLYAVWLFPANWSHHLRLLDTSDTLFDNNKHEHWYWHESLTKPIHCQSQQTMYGNYIVSKFKRYSWTQTKLTNSSSTMNTKEFSKKKRIKIRRCLDNDIRTTQKINCWM